jgi:hypothetical protein
MKKIVIAHGHTSIEILHSILPFIHSSKIRKDWNWEFIDYKLKNIFKTNGDLLILVRKYHDGKTSNDRIIYELKELKKNYNKIVYFDDSAAASVIFFCAFPYVNEYWKRSILKNLDLYKNKLYGGHLYSDYYHQKYKIDDHDQFFFNPTISNKVNLKKLKIAWNIGIGIYPLNKNNLFDKYYKFMRKIITGLILFPSIEPIYKISLYYLDRMKNELNKEVNFNLKNLEFSSRFFYTGYRNSIGFQRKLILKKIEDEKIFLTGYKNKRDFTKEIFKTFGTISPFGWGEICYRDFESVLGGSYLIKPDMSHILTWPNIYDNDAYHSLSWDFSELKNLNHLFDPVEKCEAAVNHSRYRYLSAIKSINTRCIAMIENVL